MDIKTAIVEMLRTKGSGRTFKEFDSIPGFRGPLALEVEQSNLFWWFDCSEEAIQAIKELLDKKIIEATTTQTLSYHADGYLCPHPVGVAGKTYKSPHWLPVGINKGLKFL